MSIMQCGRETEIIRAYGVLDVPPRRELRAVAELAARVCDVPMATVNLITDLEQHQVATFGFDASICRRSDSMCALVFHERGPVVVPDARKDPRFKDNPFVTGEIGSVRFYASHPLRTPAGVLIGTLCVFDLEPRSLTPNQAGGLVTLAERVVDVLELDLRSRELAASLARQEAIRFELEESNQRLASLAGQVSHDLKTPLTSLSMSLELLRDEMLDGSRPEETMPLLDRATRSSGRMAAMIDDVLGFARLGGTLHLVAVDLDSVVDEVLVDLGGALGGVALTIDPLPVVRGDRVQLRAVMQNLLSNAAKYRSRTRPPTVHVSAAPSSSGWRVEIADNGPGVSVDDRSRLFEPLTRGTSAGDGSGIGLATCLRVIEAHDGRIGLADTPGGGTTAWFELPD